MRISDWSSDVCSSDLNPAWSDAFARLQERGRVVFSAAIDGQVYAKHGTTIDTRLTVIDRVPAADPNAFPVSPGVAPDTATPLTWVLDLVPPRAPSPEAPPPVPPIAIPPMPAKSARHPVAPALDRSDELRAGNEGVGTLRVRWSPYN